jgi:RNA polymerase sigma factor (sigma-70 family)
VNREADTEGLLRALAPRALGAVIRRHGRFVDAEDAVQEALVGAAATWPSSGIPSNPLGWLIRTASRRLVDQYRRDDARRRREDLAAAWSLDAPEPVSGQDDTLILMFMCCHPVLTPASAIPLTLRAVAGLTTREIAAAFLVPESTMAQRISRSKIKVKEAAVVFRMPSASERSARLRSVLHVLYLLFNEGYATSAGPDLGRTDLAAEAVRLARTVRTSLPDDPEVAGLLALMLLTEARRPARTGPDGELVPLSEQDRGLWDQALIVEGLDLVTLALQADQVGEYQLQAAIAAVHDQAANSGETDWRRIVTLYVLLERMTHNPMVTLNRAAAAAMVEGPSAGLALLDGLGERLGDHHRLHSVRAHLLEQAGDTAAALTEFRAAAARATNVREQNYLVTRAARLASELPN